VAARVALANQLRAELERFWPGPIGLFSDLDSPISLAFLARYPSPADTRGLGEKRIAAFLTKGPPNDAVVQLLANQSLGQYRVKLRLLAPGRRRQTRGTTLAIDSLPRTSARGVWSRWVHTASPVGALA
jgi:hypothetical protein